MSSVDSSTPQLNAGTVIGIVVSTIVFIAFCTALIILLRLSSNHRRLVTDIESRGIEVPRFGVKNISTGKPGKYRTVLTRAQLIPFSKSAWNHLDSVESIACNGMAEGMVDYHQYWPKESRVSLVRQALMKQPITLTNLNAERIPALAEGQRSLLSSPFSSHLLPSHQESLSTFRFPDHFGVLPFEGEVVEKYLSSPYTTAGMEMQEDLKPKPLFSQGNKYAIPTEPEIRVRKDRSETMNAHARPSTVLDDMTLKFKTHSRSLSLGYQGPGRAPEAPVPPLPHPSENLQTQSTIWLRSGNVAKIDSHQSFSSLDSVGSSVLINSPRITRSSSARFRHGHHLNNSLNLGTRPLRKAKSLHRQALSWSGRKQLDVKHCRSSSRHSLTLLSKQDSITPRPQSIIEEPEVSNETPKEVFLKPIKVQNSKHGDQKMLKTPAGSPVEKCESQIKGVTSPSQSPNSTALSSTRSSNGNPFHWDPYLLSISKGVSRGSPLSRRNLRRRPGLQLSNPFSQGFSNLTVANVTKCSVLDCSSNPRPLPRPPSSSKFEPDIKLGLTNLRASLTPASQRLNTSRYSQDGEIFGPGDSNHSSKVPGNGSMSIWDFPKFPYPATTGAVANFSFIRTLNTTESHNSANHLRDSMKLDDETRVDCEDTLSPTHLDRENVAYSIPSKGHVASESATQPDLNSSSRSILEYHPKVSSNCSPESQASRLPSNINLEAKQHENIRNDLVPGLFQPTKPSVSVNVWEDGETFWTRLIGKANTPQSERKVLDHSSLRINILPPSNEATPRSLYDQEGFLVENHHGKSHNPFM